MKREIRITGKIPSYQEFIIQELGRLLEANCTLSTKFHEGFTPTKNQKMLFELIESSTVPKDRSIHLLLYGGTGGSKSWGAIGYALDKLLSFPNTNVLAVRRTQTDIKTSIWRDTRDFLDRWGIPYQANQSDFTLTMPNQSLMTMRSDKSLVQAKKDKSDGLGSTRFSVVILEEADSISEEVADTMPGRMREETGDFRRIIFYICNPPDESHWLYELFFGVNPRTGKVNDPDDPASRYRALHMPSEGNEHLRAGYLDDITDDFGRKSALSDRMRDGQFGPAVRGIPIFKDSFNLATHVAEHDLSPEWNRDLPMFRCWDFGYRGMAIVIGQDDIQRRQIRIFVAEVKKNCLLDTFADEQLLKCLRMFPDAEWMDYCDPAGAQRTGLSPLTYHDILRSKGINPKFKNSTIEYGLNIIEEVFNSTIKQRPCFLISPILSKPLYKALQSGYCNDKDRIDQGVNPVKDGVYDHIVDALRYGMIFLRKPGYPVGSGRQMNRGYSQYSEESFSPRGVIQVGQRQGNGFNKSRM